MPPSEPPSPNAEPLPAHPIRIEWGQASDPGRDPTKQVNEDSAGYAETPFGHLFVVCDGMGGHTGGRQASDTAIRTIFEEVTGSAGERTAREALEHAIGAAAQRVYALGGTTDSFQRPGTTCVALLLQQGRAETAHVGDSRAYAIRGRRISRLTRDHSMVQELVDAGSLTEEEAAVHPDANKITRALGMNEEVEVELRGEPLELYADDVFVLATDGLTDLVSGEEILQLTLGSIEIESPSRACRDLVALANDRGGHDNITVQVVRVVSTGPKRSRTLAQEPSAFADDSGPGDDPSPPGSTPGGQPVTASRGDDTVPDDGAPTLLEPASDAAPTKVIEPPVRVATTAPDAPTPTIPGVPHAAEGGAPRRNGTSAALPERPQPTVVDPALATQHADAAARASATPSAATPAAASGAPSWAAGRARNPLMIAVIVMAVIIGVLVTLLAWLTLGS